MKALRHIFTIGVLLAATGLSNCIQEEDDLDQNCIAHCAQVKGTLRTDNGNWGLADIPLTIKWNHIKYLSGGIIRTKGRTATDANGDFAFKFSMREDELLAGYFTVEYDIDTAKYLTFGQNSFMLDDVKPDTIIAVDYLIPAKAFLNCTLLNLDKMAPTDYFASEFNSPMGYDGQCCSGSVITWTQAFSGKFKVTVAGDQPIYIKTYKRVNSVSTVTYDTLSVPRGKTQPYIVDFSK